MQYFLKIAENVDVLPLLLALKAKPFLWNQIKTRKYENSPHKAADDVVLWFANLDQDFNNLVEDIQTHPCDAWHELPQARPIVFDLMRRVEGTQLGRVAIVRLPSGEKIEEHKDHGLPAHFYKRFHISLQCNEGCYFIIEDEKVNFKSGDVWMIDQLSTHSVVNDSNDDRIVMIVDIRVV